MAKSLAYIVIIFILYISCTHKIKPDYLYYNGKHLSWSLFNYGQVPNNFAANIYTGLQWFQSDSTKIILAFMDTRKSFYNASANKQTLIDENYHFKIAEFYARLLRQKAIENKYDFKTETFKDLFDYSLKELSKAQEHYDSVTQHGLKTYEQEIIQLQIDGLLEKYRKYESPVVYFKRAL